MNCCIKRSRITERNEFEVIVGNKTTVVKSPIKFKIDTETETASSYYSPELTTLELVKDVAEHQHVTITGKVVSVSATEQVILKNSGKSLLKMDFVIADCTAVYRGVAWEGHIKTVKEEHSYKICNATVRSINGSKYISIGENCAIKEIEDIGEVIDDVNIEDPPGAAQVIIGEIVAVIAMDEYKSCRNCTAKVIEEGGKLAMGVCSKCNTKMKLSKCNKQCVAHVIVEDEKGKEHKVTVFNDVLQQIANYGKEVVGAEADISEQVLSVPSLNYTLTKKDIVSCVSACM